MFHAARQDIEIFFNLSGTVPAPLFDTQIAAMVCGFGDAASYETLVAKLAQASLDKSSRFTDWAHRPLTERQIHYALADVVHLRTVYERLQQRLASNGRATWFAEEMAGLSDPATYRSDPHDAWRRFRLRGRVDPGSLPFCANSRRGAKTAAQQRNLPRGRIMRDEAVLEIAAHAPKTIDALARTRSLGKGVAEGKLGNEILDAVRRGLAETRAWRHRRRADVPPGLGPLVELLRVLLKQRCEEHQVAQKLVATGEDLEAVAADDDAPVPALSGWRYEIFGKDALALKHGRLAHDGSQKPHQSGRAGGRRPSSAIAPPIRFATVVSLTPSRGPPPRFPPPHHRCGAERPGEDLETALAPSRRHRGCRSMGFRGPGCFPRGTAGVGQEISRAAAQGVGETKRQAERANLRGRIARRAIGGSAP